VHDWDAVQTPVVFDAEFHGAKRKLLAQASRNGYFFVLDRTNGKNLLTKPFIETNWSSGIDALGRPVAKASKDPTPDGSLVEPGSDGATNWMSPSFNPLTGLFYVSARRIFSEFYLSAEGKPEGWGGRDRNIWANSVLEAIDYQTGDIRWSHELGRGEGVAGILTTAGGVLFMADASGNMMVLDAASGRTLWHAAAGGRTENCPMSYELDGRQYVVMAANDLLFAWASPEKR
jgi:alcohol dehydrogenase (cytochrome c)